MTDAVNEKKNIAFLINNMSRGGAQRVISRIAVPLEKYFNVHLILLDSSNKAYTCNVETINLSDKEEKNKVKYFFGLIRQGKKIKKIVKEKNIDCVISFLTIPNIINLYFLHGIKRIISIRVAACYDLNEGTVGRIKHRIEKKLSKKADAVIVPSQELKEDYIEEYEANEEKVKVVFNPFDVSSISADSKQETGLLFNGKPYIVSVGRLDRQKGFEHLIYAFKKVCEKNDEINLLILGEGSLREKLTNLTHELGLADRVLMYGAVDNPFKYIGRAKVFVMSSLAEGFPNALVEAMACAVPVISTDCLTGPKEIFRDVYSDTSVEGQYESAEYGILIPCVTDDEDGTEKYAIWADAIEYLLDDEEANKKYSVKAYERACEYSLETSIEEYFNVIDKVVKS